MGSSENTNNELKELKKLLDEERHKGLVGMIKALEETTNLKLDNQHSENQLILKQILEQATKTNGRVTKIEDVIIPSIENKISGHKRKMRAYEMVADHPVVSGFILLGIVLVFKFIPTEWILNYLNLK